MNRLKALEAVAEAARIVRRLAGARYPTEAEHKLDKALSALTPAAGGGCVSAAPAGCTSDSECAAAGRYLERALPADPAPAEVVEVAVELWVHKDGDICVLLPGSFIARDWETSRFRRRLGATRLPLVKGDAQ